MVLNNVILTGGNTSSSIEIGNGQVMAVTEHHATTGRKDIFQIEFTDAIAFPGLINSHDHLDFNLFAAYGDKKYNNYIEWGQEVHPRYKKEIADVLEIPEPLRIQWGIYKNLLCGVTTVVNHGKKITTGHTPIDVFQHTQSLHSPGLEKNWKFKLNNPFKARLSATIHVGEGVDKISTEEIERLIKWNILAREIIAIHGVAMNEKQARHFSALVWCPVSNYFLLGKTADIGQLQKHTRVILGTDSTLSGTWNIWEHIRCARNTHMVDDQTLFEMLGPQAAAVWGFRDKGIIAAGQQADIVIARFKNKSNSMNAFFETNPEDLLLVMQKGNIRLFDEELYEQLTAMHITLKGFGKITINGAVKYVEGDLQGLMSSIRKYHPTAFLNNAII